ncbi:MAG: sigma D regulator [Psychrobium sp.]|nr:sigma D regulator [Psychrobium sp.]
MLKKVELAQQQWGGSNQLIDAWLNKRQELIVNYCQIAGIAPFEQNIQQLPAGQDISEFCNRLVDYVSTGHFEIYREVVSQCEIHGKESLNYAEELIPKISYSTDISLEFTDKYADTNDTEMVDLDAHLSTLIEGLEQRFELEDLLLSNLHEKHHQSV